MRFDIIANAKVWQNFANTQFSNEYFNFNDLQTGLKEYNATVTAEDARDGMVSFDQEQDLVYFIMRWA